ncbi:hypothetical protein [Streptomyces clavifer]
MIGAAIAALTLIPTVAIALVQRRRRGASTVVAGPRHAVED